MTGLKARPVSVRAQVGIRRSVLAATSAVGLLLSGCAAPTPNPHYVLGQPYQKGGVWYYPKESFDLDETGLAVVAPGSFQPRLATDGEVFDPSSLEAGHPTLQLPAIARLTNLENGRQVSVRINDRGTGNPHNLVEVTERTASLLGFPSKGAARVRLTVLAMESQGAASALPGAPSLAMQTAPRGAVEVAELAPPPGVRQGNGRNVAGATPADRIDAVADVPPLRLPEVVTHTTPNPGALFVELDTFQEYQYAAVQQARMSYAGARIVSVTEGRTNLFRVEVGPFQDAAQASSIMDQALSIGIPDARIVVQ